MRYWEDFEAGETTETGPIHVTEEEIIEFASKYDPQPFHIDPEAGKQTMYGGLIASGWHTAALYMGAFVRATLGKSASLGAPPGSSCTRMRASLPAQRSCASHAASYTKFVFS